MVLLVSVVMFFVTLIWATMRDKKDIEEVLARYDLGSVHDCSTAKAALDEGQPTPRCLYVRGDCPNWANAKVSIATNHKIDYINWFPSPQPWNPVKGPIYSDWGRRRHSGDSTWSLVLCACLEQRSLSGSDPLGLQEELLQKRIIGYFLDDSGKVNILYCLLQLRFLGFDPLPSYKAFGTPGESADLARQQRDPRDAAVVSQLRYSARSPNWRKVPLPRRPLAGY